MSEKEKMSDESSERGEIKCKVSLRKNFSKP